MRFPFALPFASSADVSAPLCLSHIRQISGGTHSVYTHSGGRS